MPYYEAIIGTAYQDSEYTHVAVAEAVWNLIPVLTMGPPADINVYGADDSDQFIGVGVVFETDQSHQAIMDCGAEVADEVFIG